jgi:hypothetical protein
MFHHENDPWESVLEWRSANERNGARARVIHNPDDKPLPAVRRLSDTRGRSAPWRGAGRIAVRAYAEE